MKFYTRLQFEGKNLAEQDIVIPRHTYVDADSRYILWNKIPVCAIDSQIARDYFIWADDGKELARIQYEETIIFNPRFRQWEGKVPVKDETGRIIDYKIVTMESRYTPEEVDYMLNNFGQFFDNKDSVVFNKYFFIGSHIEEVGALADYLNR